MPRETGAPDIIAFMNWLRRAKGITLCSAGGPGEVLERVDPIEDLIVEFRRYQMLSK